MRAGQMTIAVSASAWVPRRTFAPALLVTLALAACSSTTAPGSADAPPPPPQAPAPVLDFAAIAGEWEGTVTEIRQAAIYPVQIALDAEAVLGAPAGTVDYGVDWCGGNLMAAEASGGVYVLDEFLTYGSGCVQGARVRLIHNSAAGTLDYEWYSPSGALSATAELTRQE